MKRNNYLRRKSIKYPKPSEAFAEFIGIFLGDGCFSNKYQIKISYNHKSEQKYTKHIRKIVFGLFGLTSKIHFRKKYGSSEVVVTSSNLVEYLRNTIGISKGREKSKVVLPAWLLKSKKYKAGFIRGLFDSEGCIYQHKYYSNNKAYSYIKIAVTNYCDKILSFLYNFLTDLDIHSIKYNKRVHIYCKSDVEKFFEIVGSNNHKNKLRLKYFIKTGEVA